MAQYIVKYVGWEGGGGGGWCFFFFQAEDGIRDDLVTGVQTCALPICLYTRGDAVMATFLLVKSQLSLLVNMGVSS